MWRPMKNLGRRSVKKVNKVKSRKILCTGRTERGGQGENRIDEGKRGNHSRFVEERRGKSGDFTAMCNGENRTGGGNRDGGDAITTVEREGEGGGEREGVEMGRKGELQQERGREGEELSFSKESREEGGGRWVTGTEEGKEVRKEVGVAVEERGRRGRGGGGKGGERGSGLSGRESLLSCVEESASYVERYDGVV